MGTDRALDYLNRLQEASYRHFGLTLPTYSAEEFV